MVMCNYKHPYIWSSVTVSIYIYGHVYVCTYLVKCSCKHLYIWSCVFMYMCNNGYGHVNMDLILHVHITKNVWFSSVEG